MGGVASGAEELADGHVHRHAHLLPRVFHVFRGRIFNVLIFVGKGAAGIYHLLVGLHHAHVDHAVAGFGGDVAGNGEGDAEAAYVLALASRLAVVFERFDAHGCGVELCGDGHLFRKSRVALVQARYLVFGACGIGEGGIALAHEGLVELLQRVNLADIVFEHLAHGGQFLFQSEDFGRAGVLHVFQFFEQAFCAALFCIEACHEAIVADCFLHLAILQCKLGVLVFHFLFVEFGKLAQFFKFFLFVCQFLGVGIAAREQRAEPHGGEAKRG